MPNEFVVKNGLIVKGDVTSSYLSSSRLYGTSSYALTSSYTYTSSYISASNIDHSQLNNLNSTNYTHLTSTNHTDLTDGGDSTLHYHSSDRNLVNSTGILPLDKLTGSYNITSSWSNNSISSSFSTTSSYYNQKWLATGSFYPITSSWSSNTINSNISISSSYASRSLSSSYSLTASYISGTFNVYVATASWTFTASIANTASYIGDGTDNYIPKWLNNRLTPSSSIYNTDNYVGIQTNNPIYTLDVYGTERIDDGLILPHNMVPSNAGMTTFYPVDAYFGGTNSTSTGSIKITLPFSWTNTMMHLVVPFYNYYLETGGELHVGGYNNIADTFWYNTFAYYTGKYNNMPFSDVRFGHDGTKCCILLGLTSSTWYYPKIVVNPVYITHVGSDLAWEKNWSITQTADESWFTSSIAHTRLLTDSDNADYLDSQHGSYYTNASNLNAGIVSSSLLTGLYNITSSISLLSLNTISSSYASRSLSSSYAITSSYSSTASYISGSFNILTATASWTYTASVANTASYIGDGTNNYIPKWNNNRLTQTSSIYNSGLSVGINTTSSAGNLHVVGNAYQESPSVPSIVAISNTENINKRLMLGYTSSFDGGIISCVNAATSWRPIFFNPYGGNIIIGGVNDTSFKFAIAGHIGPSGSSRIYDIGSPTATWRYIYGTLVGTSSWADNVLSSSFSITSSYYNQKWLNTGSSYPITSSWSTTSSYYNQLWLATGSLYPITSSWSINTLNSNTSISSSYASRSLSSSYSLTASFIGNGTNNYLPKWNNNNVLTNTSSIFDDNINVIINVKNPENGYPVNITGSYGYLKLGPANGFYCHFATDSPEFWFNKSIRISGSVLPFGNFDIGSSDSYWINGYIRNLYGTASYSSNNLSSSYSITSSYALNATTDYSATASYAWTASYIGEGTNNYVPKWNNNRLTQTSSIYNSGSNVGINTTSPNACIDIYGQGEGVELLRFATERPWAIYQRSTGASAALNLHCINTGKSFYITNPGNNKLFRTFAAAALADNIVTLCEDGGKVGIRLTTPTNFEVDVSGSIGPNETNRFDLGSSTYKWNNIYGNLVGTSSWSNNSTRAIQSNYSTSSLSASFASKSVSASFIGINSAPLDVVCYPVFCAGLDGEYRQLYNDLDVFTFHPTTNTLIVTNITASLYGTSSWSKGVWQENTNLQNYFGSRVGVGALPSNANYFNVQGNTNLAGELSSSATNTTAGGSGGKSWERWLQIYINGVGTRWIAIYN